MSMEIKDDTNEDVSPSFPAVFEDITEIMQIQSQQKPLRSDATLFVTFSFPRKRRKECARKYKSLYTELHALWHPQPPAAHLRPLL